MSKALYLDILVYRVTEDVPVRLLYISDPVITHCSSLRSNSSERYVWRPSQAIPN